MWNFTMEHAPWCNALIKRSYVTLREHEQFEALRHGRNTLDLKSAKVKVI